jgi:hypothetical protein
VSATFYIDKVIQYAAASGVSRLDAQAAMKESSRLTAEVERLTVCPTCGESGIRVDAFNVARAEAAERVAEQQTDALEAILAITDAITSPEVVSLRSIALHALQAAKDAS